jgi:hypothetical protein
MSVPEQVSSLSLTVYDDIHEDTKFLAAIVLYKTGNAL